MNEIRSFFARKAFTIIIISSLFAILIPVVNILYIFPTFKQTVIRNAEIEADHIASYLADEILKDGVFPTEFSSFELEIQKLKKPLNFFKIRIFSPDGTIIYSTKFEEIGSKNTKIYFHEIVASGKKFTKVVKKGAGKTQEGESLTADVVETYIPVMDGEKFIGAFEIYYDITDKEERINSVISRISFGTFAGIMVLLILSNLFVLWERQKILLPEKTHSYLYRSPVVPFIIVGALIFITEGFIMLILSSWHNLPTIFEIILDSSLLLLILCPALYFFLFRPLMLNIAERRQTEKELSAAKSVADEANEKLTAEIIDHEKTEEVLRESRERMQLALKGADLGMWDYEIPSDKWIFDERAIELVGKLPKNDAEMDSLIHPDDIMQYRDDWDSVIEGRAPVHISEYRVKNRSGQYKWLMDKGKIVERDTAGNPLRATGTIQDITEIKEVENARITHEKLESVLEMAGAICHELNQPLMAMIGYIELLEMSLSEKDQQNDNFDKIKTQVSRVKAIISKLMRITKYETKDYIQGSQILDIEKSTKNMAEGDLKK